MSNRSRTVALYSSRFSRRTGGRGGIEPDWQACSRQERSIQSTKATRASVAGGTAPRGGISPFATRAESLIQASGRSRNELSPSSVSTRNPAAAAAPWWHARQWLSRKPLASANRNPSCAETSKAQQNQTAHARNPLNDRTFGNVSNIEALAVSCSYRGTRDDGELRPLGVPTTSVPNAAAIRDSAIKDAGMRFQWGGKAQATRLRPPQSSRTGAEEHQDASRCKGIPGQSKLIVVGRERA